MRIFRIPISQTKCRSWMSISGSPLIDTDEDYDEMQDELLDRFGELPRPVINLLRIARLKEKASETTEKV